MKLSRVCTAVAVVAMCFPLPAAAQPAPPAIAERFSKALGPGATP